MKGLARYYVEHERWSEALGLYRQLAEVESTEREFKLIGLIGQAVVYDKLKDDKMVHETLAKVAPYLDGLPPNVGGTLRSELDELLKRYPLQGE